MPRIASHHLHWHWHFEFDRTPTMRWLFAMRFLRDFVTHLTTLFVPIHIYQLVAQRAILSFVPGTELQRGMIGIALYFFGYRLIALLTTIPMAKIGKRFGHVTLLLLAHFLYLGYMGSLFADRWYPLMIVGAMVFEGLQIAAFWPSYQTIMSRAVSVKRVGEDLGMLQFLLRLGTILSPALGGAIIVSYGFSAVWLLGLAGTVAGMMMVANMHLKPEKDSVSWKEFGRWCKETAFKRLALTYFGRYVNDAGLALWPVYIFLLVGSVERVGFLYTFSLFIAMVLTFLAGAYVDHAGSRKPFITTGFILSMLWLARTQVLTFWHVAIVSTLDKLAADVHWLFYDAFYLRRGRGSQAYSYFVYKELIYCLSALLFWVMVATIFSFFAIGWKAVFVLAAVGVLLTLLVKENHTAEQA